MVASLPPMLLEKLHAGALGFYCRAAGLEPTALLGWVNGEGAINWTLAQLLERDLGVPADAWPRIAGRPRGAPRKMPRSLVAYKAGVLQRSRDPLGIAEDMTPEEATRRIKWGKAFRRANTRVHDILDEMGWSVGELRRKVNQHLAYHDPQRRQVSRASLQFYAAGERTVASATKRGRAPVAAPIFIRRAAEAVTEGRLKATDWPNTEDEDDA